MRKFNKIQKKSKKKRKILFNNHNQNKNQYIQMKKFSKLKKFKVK